MIHRPLRFAAGLLAFALAGAAFAHSPSAMPPSTTVTMLTQDASIATPRTASLAADPFAAPKSVFTTAAEGPPPQACSRPQNFCYCYPERCPAAI